MTVLELASKCVNTGKGKIKVINRYNADDNATFNDLSELEKYSFIANSEVMNWEFIPKNKIGAIDWDFVLEVMF